MLVLWITAALLAALAAVAVLWFARRAALAGEADPTLPLYQRQLAEVDELAARGLLSPAERDSARAEAGRRLLKAADAPGRRTGRAPRWLVPAAAGGAPLLALAVYLAVGRPELPDQPYAGRVAAWRAAPERLGPNEAAAVLEEIVRQRPADPEARSQLGRARLAAGDAFSAVRAMEQAAQMDPRTARRWTDLGRALLALDPPAGAEARRALERALQLAPGDPEARYWRGHAAVAEGDPAAGRAQWRALAASLPEGDPRRALLEAEIAQAEGGPDPAVAAMVESLAARLRENPDDADGWARLARSYAVLGREADLQAALAQARRRFSGEALARIEAEAAAGRRLQQAR